MAKTIEHPAFAPLKAAFPDVKFLANHFRDMTTLVVPREKVLEICQFLKNAPELKYDFLADLNGVDYLGFPGARGRFAVNYGLTSTTLNNRLWLKVFLDPTRDTAPGNDVRDEEATTAGDPGLMLSSVTSVWEPNTALSTPRSSITLAPTTRWTNTFALTPSGFESRLHLSLSAFSLSSL